MNRQRLQVSIRGAVQGVGFRPFVHRLAREMTLTGWVANTGQGVCLEIEGEADALRRFLVRLEAEKPAHAAFYSVEPLFLDPIGYTRFTIRESEEGPRRAVILPDIATCTECQRELFDPSNRRYLYPFTNCTHCGPRFSMVESLPYDRARTTMKNFEMCGACRNEYEDLADRRYHAEPNACPACGPRAEFWDHDGRLLGTEHQALQRAAEALREGQIVAVKGLGGFHLWVDARREKTLRLLRQRKHRQEKPFALMVPSIQWARALGKVGPLEERLLLSPESPIVLLEQRRDIDSLTSILAEAVAPGNPQLGIMLPYTPLHHLLMMEFPFPVVATSGNFSEEPICIDEQDALEELGDLADVFLVHNRPIRRPVDDSVVRVVGDRELVIRRARGYAPLPITVEPPLPALVGVGGHLKNTIAVSVGQEVFISQPAGDLETARAFEAFQDLLKDFKALYDLDWKAVACDLHPDYKSTHEAERLQAPVIPVQHHYAHVLACMAENRLEAPVLGVAWDGSGFGADGTLWGGEFLRINEQSYERSAFFRPFQLPGGDRAAREPRRAALGLLFEVFGSELFSRRDLAPVSAFKLPELALLETALTRGVQAPPTSSVGRLFDAVASILGLRQIMRFEGQAAMALEFAAHQAPTEETYPFGLQPGFSGAVIDWEPMIHALLEDGASGLSHGLCAAKFHNMLAEAVVAVAMRQGLERVALSGGCFQNRYLTERTAQRLRQAGFRPYWHQRIPPNDSALALGQIMAAARALPKEDAYVSRRAGAHYVHP